MTEIRLVVADRSAVVRSVLRRVLQMGNSIRVIGETNNGAEAVDIVRNSAPDAMVTDLDLEGVGGRDFLEAVAAARRIAVFTLIPGIRSDATRIAFAAHDLGVIAVYPKPELPEGWTDLGGVLRTSILEACGTAGVARPGAEGRDEPTPVGLGLRYVAIGASTGGPGALSEVFRAVGGNASVGIAVVQHIAAGFETILAEWLAAESGLDIAIAREGERLLPGRVRFAPPGSHLQLEKDGTLSLDRESPAVQGHKPSVNTLFQSLLGHPRSTVAAVQLSGMGTDGVEGMSKLRSAKILTIAQDEQSCGVFGMPGAAIANGAATFILAPAQIGRLLAHAAGTGK